jgi:hypothetical protein
MVQQSDCKKDSRQLLKRRRQLLPLLFLLSLLFFFSFSFSRPLFKWQVCYDAARVASPPTEDTIDLVGLCPIILDHIGQRDRKYLLVCFSANKCEILKQIDVTLFAPDRVLFDNLRLTYRAI